MARKEERVNEFGEVTGIVYFDDWSQRAGTPIGVSLSSGTTGQIVWTATSTLNSATILPPNVFDTNTLPVPAPAPPAPEKTNEQSFLLPPVLPRVIELD